MSMDALTARFFSPLVGKQTRVDESPHNQEVHMRLVHLCRLATRGSLIPCQESVAAAEMQQAGRVAGASSLQRCP